MRFLNYHTRSDHQGMRGLLPSMLSFVLAGALAAGCNQPKEHTAPAVHDRDSVPIMTTYGVNTLISDSGVIKYRIVAERWEINENRNPSRWTFDKGILLTQFDEQKRVLGYISCDSAVYYDKLRRWVLRGRVRIRTAQGVEYAQGGDADPAGPASLRPTRPRRETTGCRSSAALNRESYLNKIGHLYL